MSPFRGSAPFTQDWEHFRVERADGVATITFTRPDRLNALTFASYADLRDFFAEIPHRDDTAWWSCAAKAGRSAPAATSTRSSGPRSTMRTDELLAFTTMTGEVVRASGSRRPR